MHGMTFGNAQSHAGLGRVAICTWVAARCLHDKLYNEDQWPASCMSALANLLAIPQQGTRMALISACQCVNRANLMLHSLALIYP